MGYDTFSVAARRFDRCLHSYKLSAPFFCLPYLSGYRIRLHQDKNPIQRLLWKVCGLCSHNLLAKQKVEYWLHSCFNLRPAKAILTDTETQSFPLRGSPEFLVNFRPRNDGTRYGRLLPNPYLLTICDIIPVSFDTKETNKYPRVSVITVWGGGRRHRSCQPEAVGTVLWSLMETIRPRIP